MCRSCSVDQTERLLVLPHSIHSALPLGSRIALDWKSFRHTTVKTQKVIFSIDFHSASNGSNNFLGFSVCQKVCWKLPFAIQIQLSFWKMKCCTVFNIQYRTKCWTKSLCCQLAKPRCNGPANTLQLSLIRDLSKRPFKQPMNWLAPVSKLKSLICVQCDHSMLKRSSNLFKKQTILSPLKAVGHNAVCDYDTEWKIQMYARNAQMDFFISFT